MPKVVWSHNTMASRAMGFTPFKLLYDEEAMLPEEIKHQSLRVMKQTLVADEEYSKETIEGSRLEAVENITKYREQTRKWKDSQVVRKAHMRRRPSPKKEAQCGQCRKATTKMGRPIYDEGHRKTGIILPNRQRRKNNHSYL